MNRRQLAFVIVLNALISVVVALAVVWAVEARRPDPEALLIDAAPGAQPIILPTATPATLDASATPLPAEAMWHKTGFSGAVMLYEALVEAADPKEKLLTFMRTVHQAGANLMK